MSTYQDLSKLDGDLDYCGWEMRQAPPEVVDRLPIIAEHGMRLLCAADILLKQFGYQEEGSVFNRFLLQIFDAGRFTKVGTEIVSHDSDYELRTRFAKQEMESHGARREDLDDYFHAVQQYYESAAPLHAISGVRDGMHMNKWRLVGYKPGGSIAVRGKNNELAESGHQDLLGQNGRAFSTQLTEGVTEWKISGNNKDGTGYEVNISQKCGQIVVLHASKQNQNNNVVSATPHHTVTNTSDTLRLAELDVYYPKEAADEIEQLTDSF